MNNWYEALEVCSDFIEAWLCYHFIGIFLPDRVRGRLPFFLLSMTLVCSVKAMNAYGIDPLISTLWFVFFICMTTVVLFQVEMCIRDRNMAMSRQKKLDKMDVIELAREKPKPEFHFLEARTAGKCIFETKDMVCLLYTSFFIIIFD